MTLPLLSRNVGLRNLMPRWAHADTKWLTAGCLGCSGMLGGAAVAVAALALGKLAPTGAWVAAGCGAAVAVACFATLIRTQRRVAGYQRRRNERANAIRDQVQRGEAPNDPYFVYLRPFKIDGAFVDAARGRGDSSYIEEYGWPEAHHDLESALALLTHQLGDLVALSDNPGKAGAGYVRSTDATWQDEVCALCRDAAGIFIVPFDFEGTAWEVELLAVRGWLGKTFFVMPATARMARQMRLRWVTRDYRALWEAGRARYAALVELPPYDEHGGVTAAGEEMRLYTGFGGRLGLKDRKQAAQDLEALRARLAELADGVGQRPGS